MSVFNYNNIYLEQAAKEFYRFQQGLTKGLHTMSTLSDPRVHTTPKHLVYSQDKVNLYRYESDIRPTGKPLLIVYALVNRPYIADLQPDRSMINGLLEAGQDVYMIDWGYADHSDRYLTLDDYINGYIHRCVEFLKKEQAVEDINMLGICQGGTFSLCYSAMHPENINSLVTMVTPVDFHTPDNVLSHWVQNIDVDLLVETQGNIPGSQLNATFLALKPYRLIGQKYLDMIDIMDDPIAMERFMCMEKWIFDSPDQAAEAYRQFIKDFFQGNKLIAGEVMMGERSVDLSNLTMPILNIYANEDHLVPPSASKALKGCVRSTDYTEIAFDGGHIGIYVSGRAQKTIPPQISRWLDKRQI